MHYSLIDNRRTILLIGDSFGILKRIAFALQRRGHTIIWAESGDDGLKLAECELPDLIICESRLPGTSGMEVCRIVKGSFLHQTPVVLVGKLRNEKGDFAQAMRAGADDFFVTFTNWHLVMAKLEMFLRGSVKSRGEDRRRDGRGDEVAIEDAVEADSLTPN